MISRGWSGSGTIELSSEREWSKSRLRGNLSDRRHRPSMGTTVDGAVSVDSQGSSRPEPAQKGLGPALSRKFVVSHPVSLIQACAREDEGKCLSDRLEISAVHHVAPCRELTDAAGAGRSRGIFFLPIITTLGVAIIVGIIITIRIRRQSSTVTDALISRYRAVCRYVSSHLSSLMLYCSHLTRGPSFPPE